MHSRSTPNRRINCSLPGFSSSWCGLRLCRCGKGVQNDFNSLRLPLNLASLSVFVVNVFNALECRSRLGLGLRMLMPRCRRVAWRLTLLLRAALAQWWLCKSWGVCLFPHAFARLFDFFMSLRGVSCNGCFYKMWPLGAIVDAVFTRQCRSLEWTSIY